MKNKLFIIIFTAGLIYNVKILSSCKNTKKIQVKNRFAALLSDSDSDNEDHQKTSTQSKIESNGNFCKETIANSQTYIHKYSGLIVKAIQLTNGKFFIIEPPSLSGRQDSHNYYIKYEISIEKNLLPVPGQSLPAELFAKIKHDYEEHGKNL